jgi:hypothetical protein
MTMPANFPLHLALTKEQIEWLEVKSEDTGKSKSKLVQEMIELERKGESHHRMLTDLSAKLEQIKALEENFFANAFMQNDIVLAYVKEIFRESSASLYRLNAIVDEFPEPEKVRAEVNDFVRKQESKMREKVLQIHENG